MADEKLNTSPAENPQPSLFDTGPADNPTSEVNPPEQTAREPPEQDAPAGAPGEVNVYADQIEKLMTEKRAAERAEVKKNKPPEPRDATRAEKEEIVYLNISELFPFKDHLFGVRDDAEMKGLVESVKDNGVHQPALVRPREGGGYEIIANQ